MTKQEECFVHFKFCITSLNNAWQVLNTIRKQPPDNPLIGPAFRFALIEYSKPYQSSRGLYKSWKKLDTTHIPEKYIPLHERIITSRDQIHAHSDLTPMQPTLHINEFMGERYTLISQNIIYGTEDIQNLTEIIALIEASLDNMYIEEKVLEKKLTT